MQFLNIDYFVACDILFVPAAYDLVIGSPYWELFHRSRANDNQFFVAAISPARNEKSNYVIYGHSMIIDPTGKILAEAGIREEIIFQEIGLFQHKIEKTKSIFILE